MSAVKHTPGPWMVVGPSSENPSQVILDATGGILAEVHASHPSGYLMAAAPDLLAACEAIEAELSDGGDCYCDDPPPGESGIVECQPCQHQRWGAMLRAALSKTQGER